MSTLNEDVNNLLSGTVDKDVKEVNVSEAIAESAKPSSSSSSSSASTSAASAGKQVTLHGHSAAQTRLWSSATGDKDAESTERQSKRLKSEHSPASISAPASTTSSPSSSSDSDSDDERAGFSPGR